MKTALPASEEYYRLTRARDLREKAERWTLVARICKGSSLVSLLIAVVYGTAASGLLGGGWEVLGEFFQWSSTAGISLLLAGALYSLKCGFLEKSGNLRQDADALEVEHQARYRALPDGDE
jgi:hypothetical protein